MELVDEIDEIEETEKETEAKKEFEHAEFKMYSLLPTNMYSIVKELTLDHESITYIISICMFRKNIISGTNDWLMFVKDLPQNNMKVIAYKCLVDPITRFIFEDIPNFKVWIKEKTNITNDAHVSLLFDHRLMSSDPTILATIKTDLEEVKKKKESVSLGYLS